eukprot:COSAG04_NODE_16059_length_511_cov_0.497573_1_plen_28_part_01
MASQKDGELYKAVRGGELQTMERLIAEG